MTVPSGNIICFFYHGLDGFLELFTVFSELINKFIAGKSLRNQISENFNGEFMTIVSQRAYNKSAIFK